MSTTLRLAAALALAVTANAAPLLAPGDRFPSWELPDQTGRPIASKSLAGKTYLLWFYPRAATPGCTAEGRGLRERFAEFQRRGVEILGVSFDPPAANAEFARAESFPFRLLSDVDHRLAKAVGAAPAPEQPVASRISYLVGPDAKVLRVWGTVVPAGHAAEVLRALPVK